MRSRCVCIPTANMPRRTEVDRRARAPRRKVTSTASGPESAHPPTWIKPQLTRLVDEAPTGKEWLHEIKYDGYRMHARIDGDKIQLLTRTGLDWSHRYKRTIEALRSLKVKSAYLDGELCALNADGVPVFSRLQAATDEGRTDQLLFFAFDLLFLNGQSTAQLPLIERKERLKRLFRKEIQGLRYNEHVTGDGPRFREHACKLGLEGVISKRADRPYAPGDRGIWVKSKCLNREEFVVVGWTDPEGSRRHIGALRQPVGRSTLQPSGVEVDVGLKADSGSFDSGIRSYRVQASEHDRNHSQADEGDNGAGVSFEVASEPAIMSYPGEGALDDPSLGQDDELVGFTTFDDIEFPSTGIGNNLCDPRPLIGGISEELGD